MAYFKIHCDFSLIAMKCASFYSHFFENADKFETLQLVEISRFQFDFNIFVS
jgi:hypothetical protein